MSDSDFLERQKKEVLESGEFKSPERVSVRLKLQKYKELIEEENQKALEAEQERMNTLNTLMNEINN